MNEDRNEAASGLSRRQLFGLLGLGGATLMIVGCRRRAQAQEVGTDGNMSGGAGTTAPRSSSGSGSRSSYRSRRSRRH